MKRILKLLLPVLCLCATGHNLSAQGTTFTYQGRLNDTGSPAGGNYDLAFALYSVSSGGSAIATVTNSPTFVTNGLFTVNLDFGNVFTGSVRWLEIRVRPFGDFSARTTLTPRQQLLPTPYAIFAGSSSNAATAATLTGSVPSSGLSGSYTNIVNFNSISNQFTGFYFGNGAGLTNVPGGFLTWRIFDSTNLMALANTGYILTSSNFVTVTLPSTTNISDLLRIVGLGASGWKVQCQGGQTIFVNNIAGSPGAVWTASTAPSASWYSIAGSSDGTQMAAVNGSAAYTSSDSGENWSLRQSGIPWVSVASSANGTRLVAGATPSPNVVWTSSDSGATWIARSSIGNGAWVAVASSSDGSKLAACDYGGLIMTSTDYGTNWTSNGSSSGSRNWRAIASSTDGMKLVAVVTNGNIYTTTSGGGSWTPRDSSRRWHDVCSSSDGKKLAACVYNGQIYTSTDSGVNWIARDSTRNWSSIACSSDGTRLVATVNSGQIYTSGDSGVNWLPHTTARNWWTVTSSDDGSKLAAGVKTGGIYFSEASVNLSVTNFITGGQGSAVELLSGGFGLFIPISFMGQIFAY